jgi:antitoxin PrlF
MKEIISTLTSKGQVTIPIEVRRRLGVDQGDKLSFLLADDGRIELKTTQYLDIASLAGAAGTLQEPRTWAEMKSIAHEDRAQATHLEE